MNRTMLFIVSLGIALGSCQAPAEKQYFTESADIDLSKAVLEAYLAQNWDAYNDYFADTAKIWRNKNWTSDPGFSKAEYVESLKAGIESMSAISIEPMVWQNIVMDSGDHWVHFWGVWKGHSDVTGKDYEIPVHLASQIVNNQIVQQADFYNNTEITLDMQALEAASNEEDTVEE